MVLQWSPIKIYKKELMIFALIILMIGLIFLLQNLGYISGEFWKLLWPAILIAIGLSLLFRPREKPWFWYWHEHKFDDKEQKEFHEKMKKMFEKFEEEARKWYKENKNKD